MNRFWVGWMGRPKRKNLCLYDKVYCFWDYACLFVYFWGDYAEMKFEDLPKACQRRFLMQELQEKTEQPK